MRTDAPSVRLGRGSRPASRFGDDETGAAILEFVLVLPILLAILGGAFEIGRALLIRQTMIGVVRGGARLLAQLPDPSCLPVCTPDAARAITASVAAIVADARVPPASVQVTPQWNAAARTITLEARVDLNGPLLGLIGRSALFQLRASHEEPQIVE